MNARKANSLRSNLQTLVNDGTVATQLVAQLINELRIAKENNERQSVLTGLAEQLLGVLERQSD